MAVMEPDEKRAAAARADFAARICAEAGPLLEFAPVTVIAVKPQVFPSLAQELHPHSRDKQFVSVLAGTSIKTLREALGTESVVRFMPNLAAVLGKAVVAVTVPEGVAEGFAAVAWEIADALGGHIDLPEELLAAFTGLSGSGLAYVFAFADAMAKGGTRSGIPYPQALRIALDTMDGAIALLRRSGEHPAAYVSRVTSPAGTTIEGIAALEEGRFAATVMAAVTAAARRATELES
jgi:pyrroline-5-carboxylate reductase